MSKYTQLTLEQRYQIYAFFKAGFSKTYIASDIGVHKSTISREMKRNRGKKGYRPKQAHFLAVVRSKNAKKFIKMTSEVLSLIEGFLQQDYSPEQISGYLARKHHVQISHETIYQYVLADKARGGNLYLHLRRSHKKRKKRYGSYDRRGKIKGRISIDERPSIVDTKKRIGDWEIDTIIGKRYKGALLSIVERKSKFTLIRKLPKKQADLVAQATVDIMNPYAEKVLTITADNGQEFAHHKDIKEQLKADIYFAHPYHAWERGLSENTNGLIRQYFPKGMDFHTITDKQVEMVMNRLNNRPRKTLGFKTPNEIFLLPISKQAASF
ncbi:MAG: IS30 family transposase [Desulfobacterales bacterium]|nr:IS30 family transposase [Desulfobacterales bacterium]